MEYRIKIVKPDGTYHVLDKSFETEEAAWSYVLNTSEWSEDQEKMQDIYNDAQAVVFQVGEDGETPINMNNYIPVEEGEIRKPNSGTFLQYIALVVLIVGFAFSLINGLVINKYLSLNLRGEESLATSVAIITVVIGAFVSFVLHSLIAGFGEVIKYTAESAEYLDYLSRKEGYHRINNK